jgi:NAD-reducing hydrogenase large subunit
MIPLRRGKRVRLEQSTWARTIEIIHAAEIVRDLLLDPDIQKDDLIITPGTDAWTGEGVGVVRASGAEPK